MADFGIWLWNVYDRWGHMLQTLDSAHITIHSAEMGSGVGSCVKLACEREETCVSESSFHNLAPSHVVSCVVAENERMGRCACSRRSRCPGAQGLWKLTIEKALVRNIRTMVSRLLLILYLCAVTLISFLTNVHWSTRVLAAQ